MRRNILLVTTDQQRFDALGCNGGRFARTPVVDRLAADGLNFQRAYNQNTVCTPARSTILTGRHTRSHGVVANGIALPEDAPSVAAHLAAAGYRTALIGKAHFQPAMDPHGRYTENRLAPSGSTGPYRGFDHVELAMHGASTRLHYGHWLAEHHPEHVGSYVVALSGDGASPDTGAPEARPNPIPRELYHTDWVAGATVRWLSSLPGDAPWFAWMSFPDPHHPWDPPASEVARIRWQDLDLPAGHPGSPAAVERILATKPAHWLAYWEGRWSNREGAPARFVPSTLSDSAVLEVNAKVHVMNELIDEACGRVLAAVAERGWDDRTDVFFTTDHGEMQGDFGLLYKGPFHVEALMRLPFIWRPAPAAGVAPAVITDPVGHLDLAPTFCEIAGVAVPEWVEGTPLPAAPGAGRRERVLCEWDSQFPGYGMHLRTIYREGWLCTVYEPSTPNRPNGFERWLATVPPGAARSLDLQSHPMGPQSSIRYEGSEGELYAVVEDPHQFHNRFDDPAVRSWRDELVADLRDSLPEVGPPLEVSSFA